MNKDLVTINEVVNDGSCIFFYQEEISGVWVTYGYSAYLLSQMSGIGILSSFSEQMQMPCVCITNADFRGIVKNNMTIMECRDGYFYLPTTSKVEENLYRQWTNSLK